MIHFADTLLRAHSNSSNSPSYEDKDLIYRQYFSGPNIYWTCGRLFLLQFTQLFLSVDKSLHYCFSFPSSQQNVGFLKVCKYVPRLYLFLFCIMMENFHTIFIVLTFHSLFIVFRCRFFMAFSIVFTFEFRKCCESFDVCWVTIQYMKG